MALEQVIHHSLLHISLATEDDAPSIRVLVNSAYRSLGDLGLNFTGSYQDEDLTRQRMRGNDVFLLHMEGALVGTVSLGQDVALDGETVLYLSQLAVSPARQRHGIGRYLLQFAETEARKREIRRIQLDTAIPAIHLVEFYRSEGYEVIDEAQWEGKTYRSYVMEKRLITSER